MHTIFIQYIEFAIFDRQFSSSQLMKKKSCKIASFPRKIKNVIIYKNVHQQKIRFIIVDFFQIYLNKSIIYSNLPLMYIDCIHCELSNRARHQLVNNSNQLFALYFPTYLSHKGIQMFHHYFRVDNLLSQQSIPRYQYDFV